MERIKDSGDIFLAVDDHAWVLDGAAVTVAIICFDDGTEQKKVLNNQQVKKINANYLRVLTLLKLRN